MDRRVACCWLSGSQYNAAQTAAVLDKASRMEATLGSASTSEELETKYREFVAGGK